MAEEKKKGYQIYPAPSPWSYDIALDPQPLASVPSRYALLVIMIFLEN